MGPKYRLKGSVPKPEPKPTVNPGDLIQLPTGNQQAAPHQQIPRKYVRVQPEVANKLMEPNRTATKESQQVGQLSAISTKIKPPFEVAQLHKELNSLVNMQHRLAHDDQFEMQECEDVTRIVKKHAQVDRYFRRVLFELKGKSHKVSDIRILKSNTRPLIVYIYSCHFAQQTKSIRLLLQIVPESKATFELVKRLFSLFYEEVNQNETELFETARSLAGPVNPYEDDNNSEWSIFAVPGQTERANYLAITPKYQFIIMNHHDLQQQRVRTVNAQIEAASEANAEHPPEPVYETSNAIGNEQLDSDDQIPQPAPVNDQKTQEKLKDAIQKALKWTPHAHTEKLKKTRERLEQLEQSGKNRFKQAELREEVKELEEKLKVFNTSKKVIEKDAKKNIEKGSSIKELQKLVRRAESLERDFQTKLPILLYKRVIFESLQKDNLLILEGETGSGKSTQMPQIMLEYFDTYKDSEMLPILMSQPRKIAVRNLAERLAFEMKEPLHNRVSYQIVEHKQPANSASVVIKLDWLIVNETITDPLLSKYSCLLLDEAHERTVNTDVLLSSIKNILVQRPDFKIIIMSASLETGLFQQFYKNQSLKVPGRMHPVEILYEPLYPKQNIINKIEQIIIDRLLQNRTSVREEYKGHFLVFCDSVQQIEILCKIFNNKLDRTSFKIMALHGRVPPHVQKEVFQDCRQTKIIFASRIAETSITINNVRVVIDPGLDLQTVFDPLTCISTKRLQPISKSAALQRAGRAGRTTNGFCFRLYSRDDFNKRQEGKVPQIKNMSLDSLVLRLKAIGIENVLKFNFISPPETHYLVNAIQNLKLIQLLDSKGEITAEGSLLVNVPIDPALAKSILEAKLLDNMFKRDSKQFMAAVGRLSENDKNKLREVILEDEVLMLVAAVTNNEQILGGPQGQTQEADYLKYKEFAEKDGDFFMFQNIYFDFCKFKKQGQRQGYALSQWLAKHNLSRRGLESTEEMIEELKGLSRQMRIDQADTKLKREELFKKLNCCKTFKDVVVSCLMPFYGRNVCVFSGGSEIGYTLLSQERNIKLEKCTALDLLGLYPPWIVVANIFTNQQGRYLCRIAQQVSFQFLVGTMTPQLIEKLQITKNNKDNPLYDMKNLKYPTVVMKQILAILNHRHYEPSSSPLKAIELVKIWPNGEAQIIWRKSDSHKAFAALAYLDSEAIKKIEALKQPLAINYTGNYNLLVGQGFQIAQVSQENVYDIEVVSAGSNLDWLDVHFRLASGCYTNRLREDKLVVRAMSAQIKDEAIDFLIHFQRNNCSNQSQLKWNFRLTHQSDMNPALRLRMTFLNGGLQRKGRYNQINMGYFCDISYVEGYLDSLKKGIQNNPQKLTQQMNKMGKRVSSDSFSQTQRGTGINYRGDMNEIQLLSFLELVKKRNISLRFELPRNICAFRTAGRSSIKSLEMCLRDLLKDCCEDPQEVNYVSLKHIDQPIFREKRHPQSTSIPHPPVVCLEISTTDSKMLNLFQKSTPNFGEDKAYYMRHYSMKVATAYESLFQKMLFDYTELKYQAVLRHPDIIFKETQRKLNGDRIYIQIWCQSKKQDHLFGTEIQRISEMFTPTYLPLTLLEMHYLTNTQEGGDLLDKLENQFQMMVYFGFEKTIKSLKIYVSRQINSTLTADQVQQKLLSSLRSKSELPLCVTYRGRNLIEVEKLLVNFKNKYGARKFHYTLNLSRRQINARATRDILRELMNSISQIFGGASESCAICHNAAINPFVFSNCMHIACDNCVARHIRQVVYDLKPNELIGCPQEGCQQLINHYDIYSYLAYSEMKELCSIKIKDYLIHNKQYIQCSSELCQNLIQTSKIIRLTVFACMVCGHIHCKKCPGLKANQKCPHQMQ